VTGSWTARTERMSTDVVRSCMFPGEVTESPQNPVLTLPICEMGPRSCQCHVMSSVGILLAVGLGDIGQEYYMELKFS
jgi:hypothetical protein